MKYFYILNFIEHKKTQKNETNDHTIYVPKNEKNQVMKSNVWLKLVRLLF